MERKRSVGITILIFVLLIVPLVFLSSFRRVAGLYPGSQLLYWPFEVIVYPIMPLLIVRGLLILKRWARILAVIFMWLQCLDGIWILINIIVVRVVSPRMMPSPSFERNLIWYGIVAGTWLISIYYLTRPKVKEQFR